jgi:hypothetical protein
LKKEQNEKEIEEIDEKSINFNNFQFIEEKSENVEKKSINFNNFEFIDDEN